MESQTGQFTEVAGNSSSGTRTLVVLPAFNEEQSLGKVLSQLREIHPQFNYLVVNDGSTDRTAEVARRHGARVISLPCNSGYGCAVKAGLIYAERNGYDLAVLLDSDGQHDPLSVCDLMRPILEEAADVVLGNRYGVPDAQRSGSWLQRTGHAYLSLLLRIMTGRRIHDPMSGFQAISRRGLWFYVSDNFPDDYPDANVVLMLHRAGIRLVEVPAIFHSRSTGQSMHGGLWRPLLYLIRATLAILMVWFRARPRKESSS